MVWIYDKICLPSQNRNFSGKTLFALGNNDNKDVNMHPCLIWENHEETWTIANRIVLKRWTLGLSLVCSWSHLSFHFQNINFAFYFSPCGEGIKLNLLKSTVQKTVNSKTVSIAISSCISFACVFKQKLNNVFHCF